MARKPASPLHFMTAAEAASRLGVTKATLYAYTSRGQLRSEPSPESPRSRRYHREDVEHLRERKDARRDPAKAAAGGLHWGSPVLDSRLTLIRDGRIYYRGRDVLDLSRTASLEEVAAILWDGPASAKKLLKDTESAPRTRTASAIDPLARFQSVLPLVGASDLTAYDLRPQSVRDTGASILRLFASVIAGEARATPIHLAVLRAWAPRNQPAAPAIRAALVLCADHELNVSAFAARCAASADASPYDVVSVGLATLRGRKHGGTGERIARLFEESAASNRPREAAAQVLRRGESIAGFGHPLYPGGDPRAARLMELALESKNDAEIRLMTKLAAAGEDLFGDRPNLDFGLTAITRAFKLPRYAPIVLFALGRTVGWIAHAMEQYAEGNLIRPRARYVGLTPGEDHATPPLSRV